MRVLASPGPMGLAAQPVAAAATRPSSTPTGAPHSSSFAFQASTSGPITPSSQPVYEGSVVLEGVEIAAVCLALLALALRLWGILKNTDAWRNLLVLLRGADPAAAQPDEGPAAHGLLVDGDPAEGLELPLGRAPTPAETSAATETQLAIRTRECTWTTTTSSMSTRESHYSQPGFYKERFSTRS